jgi:hypothetical protein
MSSQSLIKDAREHHGHWFKGAGSRGAGAVGVGGCAWLRWPVAGLRCVSSARLRCARSLWAVAGRPPGSDLFPSGMGGRGRAVAGAGGARVRGAAVGTA